MKPLPKILLNAYLQALHAKTVPTSEQAHYQKWLRFYLDFCMKYRHPPRDRDSLAPFLQKLASKNQPIAAQEQASRGVSIYYDLMKTWPGDKTAAIAEKNTAPVLSKTDAAAPESVRPEQTVTAASSAAVSENPCDAFRPELRHRAMADDEPDMSRTVTQLTWATCYQKLKEEIKLRQYSPKTLATYRIWTEQFQRFLKDKRPNSLASDDAVRYLTYLATERHVVASTQNQAFNALLFLYRHILKTDYDLKDRVVRARRTRYIPVCLTREEVDRVIALLDYPYDSGDAGTQRCPHDHDLYAHSQKPDTEGTKKPA